MSFFVCVSILIVWKCYNAEKRWIYHSWESHLIWWIVMSFSHRLNKEAKRHPALSLSLTNHRNSSLQNHKKSIASQYEKKCQLHLCTLRTPLSFSLSLPLHCSARLCLSYYFLRYCLCAILSLWLFVPLPLFPMCSQAETSAFQVTNNKGSELLPQRPLVLTKCSCLHRRDSCWLVALISETRDEKNERLENGTNQLSVCQYKEADTTLSKDKIQSEMYYVNAEKRTTEALTSDWRL